MAKTNKKKASKQEIVTGSYREIVVNKKARFKYEVLETLEAGIVLVGTEVKSLRLKDVNLVDSYARIRNGEALLVNLHIAEYKFGNQFNHEITRERRLLLHKKEIIKLDTKTRDKGLTLIPLKLYFNEKGRVKLQLGICRGKQLHDKRQDMKEKDAQRELDRAIKRYT